MSIIIILSLTAILFIMNRISRLLDKVNNVKLRVALRIVNFFVSIAVLYFFGDAMNPTFSETAIALVASAGINLIEFLSKRNTKTVKYTFEETVEGEV